MSNSPYQVLGVGIPPMLGRERLFTELRRHLTKPTPDHMCVVGPPLFGKSVLLNHLASHFKDKGDHYVTTLYWDLRHGNPKTDDEFRQRFAERIKDTLQSVQPELAEYLDLKDHDLLNLVFNYMRSEGLRLLAVLDGFDHILSGSSITRNLWDEMRNLGQMDSLCFVTGSRHRLLDLCKTEDSRTSDFWEIFYDEPLQVGCFEEDDWDDFLDPLDKLRGITFDRSARDEIVNWTGGIPVIATALADRLLTEAPEGEELSKPHVESISEAMAEDRRGLLAALWDDCSIELRSDLVALAKGELTFSEVPDPRRRELQLRGFVRLSRNKLQSSCHFMARYAQQQASEVSNLQRLFGNAERFESNIQSLLELRLAQITGADSRLLGDIEKAIRDLLPEPTQSVNWARSIAERALDLIWEVELPANRSMPHNWKFVGVKFDEGDRLPRKRGPQCGILRLITGTEDHDPVSRFVTKQTCLLVDHLHSVGNFGQHREGSIVSVPIAATFCLSAIGLCESLARDLSKPRDTTTEEE